jgi:hypothetical protein
MKGLAIRLLAVNLLVSVGIVDSAYADSCNADCNNKFPNYWQLPDRQRCFAEKKACRMGLEVPKIKPIRIQDVQRSQRWVHQRVAEIERSMKNTPFDKKTWLETRDELIARARNTPFDLKTWERSLQEGFREAQRIARIAADRAEKEARQARIEAERIRNTRIDQVYEDRLNTARSEWNEKTAALDEQLRALNDERNRVARRIASRASDEARNAGNSVAAVVPDFKPIPLPKMNDSRDLLDRIRDLNVGDASQEIAGLGERASAAGQRFDRNVLQPTARSLDQAGQDFDTQVIRPVVDSAKDALNREIAVYDLVTKGAFTVNLKTGAYWVRVDLPYGMSLGSLDFERLLSGRFTLPDIDPIEVALKGAVTKSSGYDEIAQRYPGSNVYFVSERFADWFSLETLAGEGLKAYVTGGKSVESAADRIKQLLLLEWNDLLTWLEAQGSRYAEDLSFAALQAILSGESVEFTDLGVRLDVLNIPYLFGDN